MLGVFQQYGVLASFVAAFISLCGVASVWLARERVLGWSNLLAAFGAGLLLTTVLTHLFPEAMQSTSHAPLYALGGYVLLLLIAGLTDSLFPHSAHHHPAVSMPALTAWLGIAFHSFVDGAVYTVTYESGLETGLMTMGGLTAHKFIDAVILFALMSFYVSARRALIYTVLGAVLMTPLGAVLTVLWLDGAHYGAGFAAPLTAAPHDHGAMLGPLLAAAGGTLLYVSASHLVPHMLEAKRRLALPLFLLGCALSLFMEHALH